MRRLLQFCSFILLVGLPIQHASAQVEPFELKSDKMLAGTYINSSEQGSKDAIELFRRSVNQRDKLIFVSGDFLYRSCALRDGKLEDPEFEVGKLSENYSTGDVQIESMVFVPAVELDKRSESKSFGEDWQEEKQRLEEFVEAQANKPDYVPTDLGLEPISRFFSREDFRPRTGGACINSLDLSARHRVGGKIVLIDAPGMSLPNWIHYFDTRALGLSNRLEISKGTSLGEVLLRHNTGLPFSVEKCAGGQYVSVVFEKVVRRILFDSQKGYLPVYSADFRGGQRGESRALLVEKPRLQTWIKPVQIGQHWMPERFRLLDDTALIDIEFKWWSVNTEIPDDAFTVESLWLAPGTKVIDRRLVPPVTTILGR